MSLRLSTGFCRGMTLAAPSSGTRPTAGRVRSAIWNSLQGRLNGAHVLDVCAGSGAVGIEALSRGAKSASFIENDRNSFRLLQQNLAEVERRAKNLGLAIAVRCHGEAAEKTLKQLESASFDIIWIDPPFAIAGELLKKIGSELHRLLKPEGQLVVESDSADLPQLLSWLNPPPLELWLLEKQKSYGKIGVSFLKANDVSL